MSSMSPTAALAVVQDHHLETEPSTEVLVSDTSSTLAEPAIDTPVSPTGRTITLPYRPRNRPEPTLSMSSTSLTDAPTVGQNGYLEAELVVEGLASDTSSTVVEPSDTASTLAELSDTSSMLTEPTVDTSRWPSGRTVTLPFRPRNSPPQSNNQDGPTTPVVHGGHLETELGNEGLYSGTSSSTLANPIVDTPHSPTGQTITTPKRPSNESPNSQDQNRPKTPVNSLAAPAMMRAHSSPVVGTSGRVPTPTTFGRPSSPLGSYRRYNSPSRRLADETGISFGGQSLTGIGETVFEDDEAKNATASKDFQYNAPGSSSYQSNTFPRRRSASPLHQALHPSTFGPVANYTRSGRSSPNLSISRYNESYPSSTSMPSTPTSMRSRSPSISSLETIPDSPEAEAAEFEAERIAKLKAAADAADAADAAAAGAMSISPSEGRRRSYLDVTQPRGRGGALLPGSGSLGFAYSTRDKRKRWSVCGAERMSELDPIWEDPSQQSGGGETDEGIFSGHNLNLAPAQTGDGEGL